MSRFSLEQALDLVGVLDDSLGDDTARQRFRRFLHRNVVEVGTLKDFLQECLRGKETNHNRALQDLVNYTGEFLDFDVEYGRYAGVTNAPGFDGLWTSPIGFHVVVEVKTSEVFNVRVSTLTGYIDELVEDGRIPDRERAMGLFVVGRPDPESSQIAQAITAQRLTNVDMEGPVK